MYQFVRTMSVYAVLEPLPHSSIASTTIKKNAQAASLATEDPSQRQGLLTAPRALKTRVAALVEQRLLGPIA
jgi:hypothetical protein